MSDAIRLNAPVSSFSPAGSLPDLPVRSLAMTPRAIDTLGSAKATKQLTNPRLSLATPQGIRIGEPAPGTAMQTTPMQANASSDVVLVNVTAEEAQQAVQESLRVISQLKGQSVVASRNQYAPAQVLKDDIGMRHVRMNRLIDGMPVFNEQLVTHLSKEGQVVSINGATDTTVPKIETTAKLTGDAATAIAVKAFGETPEETSKPQLLVTKGDDGKYHLAYRVIVAKLDEPQEPRKVSYFIDAQSGESLFSFNEIHGFVPEWLQPKPGSATAPAQSTVKADAVIQAGQGNSLYLGIVPLNTSRSGGFFSSGFTLKDPSNNAETRDAGNKSSSPIFGDGFNKAREITDSNNRWGEPSDDARARAGIDAQYISVKYLEYLKDMYQRSGIDGRGLVSHSLVHVNNNYVNAYWDGTKMNYGDGDGVNAGPLVDKDVASHEPTHGVTQATSNLTYRGESGALNEAMSDIIGSAGFSWWLRGKKDSGISTDFWVGEDCWTPNVAGDALRYMDHPTRDRRGMSDMYSRDNYASRYTGDSDNGGVHINSGIANNAFYLLANGGTNDTSKQSVAKGLGVEKAVRIFARANMMYFTPSTTFAQARELTMKAAKDLYGDAEVATVGQAWSAVGVSG
jgi:bacillolysin